jgi:hypothetical protein
MSSVAKSMVRPEVAAESNPRPVEKILATILRFTEWLDKYGEVSYDF